MVYSSIFVLDTETTGTKAYPENFVLEISVYRLQLENNGITIEEMLSTLIGYEKKYVNIINDSYWAKNMAKLTYTKIMKTKPPTVSEVWKQLRDLIEEKPVISWHTDFDFGKFIQPMMEDLGKIELDLLSCPMKINTDIMKMPHKKKYERYFKSKGQEYKYPSLSEAGEYYGYLIGENNEETGKRDYTPSDRLRELIGDRELQLHRASFDTYLTSLIVKDMIENNTLAM